MADFTLIQQGRFTSTGASVTIPLRSGVDWMRVYNTTVAAANQTTAIGVEYYWQFGFPAGAQWEYLKSNAAAAANLSQYLTSGGFTYVDSSLTPNGVVNATVTAVSSASIPVVTNTGTNGLNAGDIVRLFAITGGVQLGGMDFTVGYNTLSTTTFSLDYMAQIAAATTGSWMKINYDALYYPRRRFITKITQAANAVVTLSVTHGYLPGQKVKLLVPEDFGMIEMDALYATIIAVNTTTTSGNTITLDIDSTAFTAFAFPTSSVGLSFTPAQVVPVGENSAEALVLGVDFLNDATINTGYIGMSLAAGANSPAGQNADVIYWVAGTSFNVNNQ